MTPANEREQQKVREEEARRLEQLRKEAHDVALERILKDAKREEQSGE
jgi:hypothetical protein